MNQQAKYLSPRRILATFFPIRLPHLVDNQNLPPACLSPGKIHLHVMMSHPSQAGYVVDQTVFNNTCNPCQGKSIEEGLDCRPETLGKDPTSCTQYLYKNQYLPKTSLSFSLDHGIDAFSRSQKSLVRDLELSGSRCLGITVPHPTSRAPRFAGPLTGGGQIPLYSPNCLQIARLMGKLTPTCQLGCTPRTNTRTPRPPTSLPDELLG